MAMTEVEYVTKIQIFERLAEEGYPSYARLFRMFDLNLTEDPSIVGYMVPGKALIVINRNLRPDQVGVIVRHEILHEYLNHMLRMEEKKTKAIWDKRTAKQHELSNIAADFDISNQGYTEADKKIIRNLDLGGKLVAGLVTEDHHKDWLDKTFEEMYDLLEKELEKEKQKALNELKKQMTPDFIKGWNDAMTDYKNGKLKG